MVFDWQDNWIVILIFVAESRDGIDSLLEIDRFAEAFIFESVSYNWSIAIVMNIDLDTFDSII